MSMTMEDGSKLWTAKRKSALVVEIIEGKTMVSEAARSCDLAPSEIEGWVGDARKGMENTLRTNPLDVHQQHEKQLNDLQEASGEALLELRTRKSCRACWTGNDPQPPAAPSRQPLQLARRQAVPLVRHSPSVGLM
ncbi:MAG: transposase [Pseudomonadota bacterium]